ncbi:peptidoglycan-binding protein [Paenibacillus dendritiformis]|uniref:LysM peptidoglycan-binding domain-containing protein n=1 Tax=Paenibacillus dendritiformis TaxID=130049 RepID=UPI0018CF6065|nr:peptidoglycan-binding protein [Paenibacillus dendritiformis]
MKIHIVKNGESLYSISQKYDVPLEELIKMNPQLKDPNEIDVGMKIKVPSSSHPQTGHEIVHKHVVKEGDTLWKLSKAWGVPLQEMIEANPQLKNPNVLVIGQVVNIPKVSGMTPPSSDGNPMHHGKGQMTAPKSKEELTAPKPKPEVTKPKVEITLPKYELEFEMEKVEYYKPEKPKHEYPICPPAPMLPIPAPPVLECPEPPAILPYMEEKPKPFYSCCPEPYAPVKDMSCGCGEPYYHHPFAQYPVPAAEVVAPSAVPPVYAGCAPWEASPVMQPPHGCGGGYPLMPYSHSSAQPVFVSPAAMGDPAPAEWPSSMPGHYDMSGHGKWYPHYGMSEHGKWNPHHGMGGYEEWNPHHGMTGDGEWHSHASHMYPGMFQTPGYPTYISPEAGWHKPEPYWGMPQHQWKKDGWEKGKTCDCGGYPREEELEAETATASSAETNGEPEERNENSNDKEKRATIRSASGKKNPRGAQKAKAPNRKLRSQGMPWISG